jgi:engulfment/cell motility protein 1
MSAHVPSPTSNGTQVRSGALVPTNTVSTGDNRTVRARIDPTLTVDDVVKQLCINLKIKDSPSNFALRDETDDLVTNDNLRKKIKAKVNLK